jgi:SAM-dependent methyltransferase
VSVQSPAGPGTSPLPAGRSAARHDLLRRLYYACSAFVFDPRRVASSWYALPYFLRNIAAYRRASGASPFQARLRDVQFGTTDRFLAAGSLRGHYFLQDLWAARRIHERGVREHVDVGSRIDGFIAHLLPFCQVTYVDLRPLEVPVEGLTYLQGSITSLPFDSGTVESLSSLHVIEHIGLGRYGDPVDPAGYLRAAAELARVLRPGGELLVGTPVGRERLCFDAHRVFDPHTVVAAFDGLTLQSFALIDDAGTAIDFTAGFARARECVYGCGLFRFTKA